MPARRKPSIAELKEAAIPPGRTTVAVIIPTFNQAHFLVDAISSVLAQTREADEIIVVDDGSTDNPALVVAQFPKVRLIRQDNRGLAAARNTGLRKCTASYVVFLDADDRLLPNALEVGLACITSRPDCAFIYGAYRLISEEGQPIGFATSPKPIDGDAYLALLRSDVVLGIMTMVHRRDCLLAVNGFDETLHACEDLDLKLRITQRYPIACHSEIVAEYRRHGQNMSNNYANMLRKVLLILDRQGAGIALDSATRAALREGRANRRRYYVSQMLAATSARWWAGRDIRILVMDLVQAARWSPFLTTRALLGALGRRVHKRLSRTIVGAIKTKASSKLRPAIRRIQQPKPRPLILMYHRIVNDPIDYFEMAVSPSHFEEHLEVLRRTRCPLPLGDFVRHLMAGALPPDAVALTFDDGYVDNLVDGKPLLAAADVPATLFLATGYIDRPGILWWDELAELILLEESPKSFELVVRGDSIRLDFGAESAACDDGTTPAVCLKRRHAVLWTLWRALRGLEDEERGSIMLKLRSIFANRSNRASVGRVMTSDEVRALISDGLVTIGAHTVNHAVLAGLEAAACHREIVESKLSCEALIGAPVAAFSYPYGDFDFEAREAVKTAGFTFACSKQRGPAIATSDIFALPRVHVRNLDGDEFERILHLASADG